MREDMVPRETLPSREKVKRRAGVREGRPCPWWGLALVVLSGIEKDLEEIPVTRELLLSPIVGIRRDDFDFAHRGHFLSPVGANTVLTMRDILS